MAGASVGATSRVLDIWWHDVWLPDGRNYDTCVQTAKWSCIGCLQKMDPFAILQHSFAYCMSTSLCWCFCSSLSHLTYDSNYSLTFTIFISFSHFQHFLFLLKYFLWLFFSSFAPPSDLIWYIEECGSGCIVDKDACGCGGVFLSIQYFYNVMVCSIKWYCKCVFRKGPAVMWYLGEQYCCFICTCI